MRVADLACIRALWAAGEIGWPQAALSDYRHRLEIRLVRNQMLCIVGHTPGAKDELPPFHHDYPLIAAAVGLTPDPDARAKHLFDTLAALSAAGESTRVD